MLILFGGGLALAAAIEASGLSLAIGAVIAAPGALPVAAIVVLTGPPGIGKTALARQLAQGLKARGFRFVGPTICYALMQAVGMVNDHIVGCFRYRQVGD